MRGTILDYDPRNGEGLISGDDNNRYKFRGTDIKSNFDDLRKGSLVDFDQENGIASSIFIVASKPDNSININLNSSTEKSRVVACVLALFLGCFGIHKFYLGYNKQGIIMLLITLFGFILFGIPSLVVCIIAFIEGIIYISKSDQDFYKTYVLNKKEWF